MLDDKGIVNQKIEPLIKKLKCGSNKLLLALLLSLAHSLVILLISYILYLCHVPTSQIYQIDHFLNVDHDMHPCVSKFD